MSNTVELFHEYKLRDPLLFSLNGVLITIFQAANRESGTENGGEENVDSDEESDDDDSEGTSDADEDQALQCAQS